MNQTLLKLLHLLYARWLILTGRAIDIWSSAPYPSCTLSNLSRHRFVIDGVQCASMEGFLQSLKYRAKKTQRIICAMHGKKAKSMTKNEAWKQNQTVYWQGRAIDRHSPEYQDLIARVYQALFTQDGTFRSALLSTGTKRLYHLRGSSDPRNTILTADEFTSHLTRLRSN